MNPAPTGNMGSEAIVPATDEPMEPEESSGPTKTRILYLRTTHVQQGVLQLHKVGFLVMSCECETIESLLFSSFTFAGARGYICGRIQNVPPNGGGMEDHGKGPTIPQLVHKAVTGTDVRFLPPHVGCCELQELSP